MKREELRDLGLNDEQVDGVLAKHHQDIKRSEDKLEELQQLSVENDELKGQLKERDADMKKLQKATADNEELTAQVTELKDKYKKSEETFNEKLNATKIENAIVAKLGETKARDTTVVKKLIDMDAVSLAEDGSVTGLDDQIDSLQKEQAYLFEGETQQKGYTPAGGDTGSDNSFANALGIVDTH